MAAPPISVILPVHNGARFLAEAIDSILAQTETDFEFLIADDGSDDETPELLVGYAARDPRIRVLTGPRRGLVATLNLLLAEARGSLLARMDGDDIALPQRLASQSRAMADRPELVLLGSAFTVIDRAGRELRRVNVVTEGTKIAARLAEANCLAHPTVMMRREPVLRTGGYRAAFRHAEDYDLWLRLAERHEIAALDEVLLRYRRHAGQVSVRDVEQRILSELGAAAAARARRAGRIVSATGARASPWNTASATVWLISAALAGDADT